MEEADDLVPAKWRSLFNNADWLIHDIVVKSIYGFMLIAIVAHALCFAWKPWLPPQF
jgi:light-harvesting complex 1 beta chain